MADIYNLSTNDNFFIGKKKYFVTGGVELEHNNFYWKEYYVKDEQGVPFSFVVEKSGANKQRYSFYKNKEKAFPLENSFIQGELYFTLFDSGIAKVVKSFGDSNISEGVTVIFKDYVAENDSDELLAYSHWDDGYISYSEGIFIPESQLRGVTFSEMEEKPKDIKLLKNQLFSLALGQYLDIEGVEYYVNNKVKNNQKGFKWWEYELVDVVSKAHYWFSVEEDNGLNLELHKTIKFKNLEDVHRPKVVHYANKSFEIVEQGSAVVEYFAKGDYDTNERFSFEEYVNKDTKEIIAIEEWVDEKEASIGKVINPFDVEIHIGKLKKVKAGDSNLYTSLFWISIIFIFVIVITSINFSSGKRKLISKQLKSASAYNLVTEITINEKPNITADVFEVILIDSDATTIYSADNDLNLEADITTDTTSKSIINKAPEEIKTVYRFNKEDNPEIFIVTKREQILIYKAENDKIYVQVSKYNKNPETAGGIYNPKDITGTNDFYKNALTLSSGKRNVESYADIDTTYYNVYTYSARQSSITRRRSSGGGTSSGK